MSAAGHLGFSLGKGGRKSQRSVKTRALKPDWLGSLPALCLGFLICTVEVIITGSSS